MRRDDISIVADGARRLREAANYEEERRRVVLGWQNDQKGSAATPLAASTRGAESTRYR